MNRRNFNRILLYGGLSLLLPSISHSKSKRLIYTFDDVPYERDRMEGLINILNDNECMFYFTGDGIKNYPESVEFLADKGYSIGWHSMHHDIMPKKNNKEFLDDILNWKNVLKDVVPEYQPKYARFPYGLGNYEQVSILISEGLLIKDHAIRSTIAHNWDVDSIDWHPTLKRNYKTMHHMIRKIRSNKPIVLLFHLQLAKPLNFKFGIVKESFITSDLEKFKMYIG